ncbi:hypothetical protein MMC07_008458 [Pseudocyphellaria aurata]|nr:hypothetical protein [Pseudocyphellaria aurata]
MAIDFQNLPDIDDAEFQSYIKRPLSASNDIKPEAQQHGDGEIDDTLPKSAVRRQRATYASFGDNGTTATVNGYGTIMRVAKLLGGKDDPSKMFGLEFSRGREPYQVAWRADSFDKELPFSHAGFGLQIMDIDMQPEALNLEFLNNRWPQISYSVKGFDVRVRLFCRNGTVIQQFTVTSTLTCEQDLQLILAVDFLMHGLNYMKFLSTDYIGEYEHGPHGHSVIVKDKNTEMDEYVGVLVGLTRNGESQKLCLTDIPHPYYLDPKNRKAVKMNYPLQESETVEFTAAFKLQYLKRSSGWKDFLLPISDMDVGGIFQKPVIPLKPRPLPRDDDDLLSWHFRRNLEHILSDNVERNATAVQGEDNVERNATAVQGEDNVERNATAVQGEDKVERNAPAVQGEDNVATPTVLTRGDLDVHSVGNISIVDEKSCDVTPVALTCGDFGDHRVSVSGSFFAFQYLLLMYEQLGNRPDGDRAAQSLRSRIYDTCKGHLQWVSELNYDQAFASNFWVDGKIIFIDQDSYTEIPPDSPANMPTHILKVTEFLKVFQRAERTHLHI